MDPINLDTSSEFFVGNLNKRKTRDEIFKELKTIPIDCLDGEPLYITKFNMPKFNARRNEEGDLLLNLGYAFVTTRKPEMAQELIEKRRMKMEDGTDLEFKPINGNKRLVATKKCKEKKYSQDKENEVIWQNGSIRHRQHKNQFGKRQKFDSSMDNRNYVTINNSYNYCRFTDSSSPSSTCSTSPCTYDRDSFEVYKRQCDDNRAQLNSLSRKFETMQVTVNESAEKIENLDKDRTTTQLVMGVMDQQNQQIEILNEHMQNQNSILSGHRAILTSSARRPTYSSLRNNSGPSEPGN